MASSPRIPKANLHTPEELLDNAETLCASSNPKMMRAAVLEAITSLEAFVQVTVFSALQNKLDPLLIQWLEEKTRMDFDSRLSILTPVAIGQPIDKGSALWNDYKRAKEIRNGVTHSGRKVSYDDAKFVIDTVREWLAYLSSTVELELALFGLKRHIEENRTEINTEKEAITIISDYFGHTKAAASSQEVDMQFGSRSIRADLILKFGSLTTIIETKFSRDGSITRLVKVTFEQVKLLLSASNFYQGAVVIFHKGALPDGFEGINKSFVSTTNDTIKKLICIVVIGIK